MPVYTSLLESNNAQFHGGLSYKHAWLSDELARQGSKVEVPELRLEPLKGDKLDLVIEYADREQAEAGSYFLRVPVDTAVVHSHSRFTECMNAVLDDINTNVRVLLPMTQTLRGMLGVKDTSITKKATLCILRKKGRRCIFNWELAQLVREYLQSGTQGPLLKEAIKKAGIGPSHKDYRAMGRKCGPRAPIRKRR
jgi:hypothetical protein